MKLSIIIPTRNEEAAIRDTLTRIAGTLGEALVRETEVIIVDDGDDSLPEIVASLTLAFADVVVMRNSPPLGKGSSLAKGFARACGALCGFLDADLSTPPRYILEALPALSHGAADLVIGSRRAEGASIQRKQNPLKTLLGGLLSSFSTRILFRGNVRFCDTQCGFKFFRNEVAKALYDGLVVSDGMADIEILLRAEQRQYRVKEIPVEWKDERKSKRPLRRTFVPDMTALARLFIIYRLLPSCSPRSSFERACK